MGSKRLNNCKITEADFNGVQNYFESLQNSICHEFESLDDKGFKPDAWSSKLGTGISCILENGTLFERCCVNRSCVAGDKMPNSAKNNNATLMNGSFRAVGVSVVAHPDNPFIPTSHFNIRFFSAQQNKSEYTWWFGGGYDLTPYYPFFDDCLHWHQVAHDACEKFGSDTYKTYKAWCDRYFFLKHRNETRGIGGLFFDDLNKWGFERCFEFVQAIGNSYCKAYLPIIQKRKHLQWNDTQKEFQRYRRGRYVEYNLLYDRGTSFGLNNNGRTESILMSLPPQVNWRYDWQPEPYSKEAELQSYLTPREWV